MIRLLLLFTLLINSAWALELRIEKDTTFKSILNAYTQQNDYQNLPLYLSSQNYRYDLTLKDLMDQVGLLTFDDYPAIHEQLKNSYLNKENFYDWFQDLKKFAKNDSQLTRRLNRKLYLQWYSINSTALIPGYKKISIKNFIHNGKMKRISRYNKYATGPEGSGLLSSNESI
jgi:hypothetical protein